MITCRYCREEFRPRRKSQFTCFKDECRRKRDTDANRKLPKRSNLALDFQSPVLLKILELYTRGLPTRQIAEQLGLTDSAVRSRLYCARKHGLLTKALRTQALKAPKPKNAWRRLHKELLDAHRNEFINAQKAPGWARSDSVL